MPLSRNEGSPELGNGLEVPRSSGPPRLLAIARDPWIVFAHWNVDWPSIFKNDRPVDRQVHLRIHCADGLEERETAAEPMAGMHYITMSQRHRSCRVEIGYYQPADVWHSVSTSNEITMPPTEVSEAEQVDLAAIPFHLSFQQLVDLYGLGDDGLAIVISRLQTRALSSAKSETLSSKEEKVLRRAGIARSEIADARRAFNQIDSEKFRRRAEELIGPGATSPSRGFEGGWTSGGS